MATSGQESFDQGKCIDRRNSLEEALPPAISVTTSVGQTICTDDSSETLDPWIEMLDSWDLGTYITNYTRLLARHLTIFFMGVAEISTDEAEPDSTEDEHEFPDSPLPDPDMRKSWRPIALPSRPTRAIARSGRRAGLPTHRSLYTTRKWPFLLICDRAWLMVRVRDRSVAATTQVATLDSGGPLTDYCIAWRGGLRLDSGRARRTRYGCRSATSTTPARPARG